MHDTTDAAVQAAVRLRAALDHLSQALLDANLEELLAAESGLAGAITAFQAPLQAPGDQQALAHEIDQLRSSIERCRRLGATVDDFLRFSSGVISPASAYDRAGREREVTPSRVLEARY